MRLLQFGGYVTHFMTTIREKLIYQSRNTHIQTFDFPADFSLHYDIFRITNIFRGLL